MSHIENNTETPSVAPKAEAEYGDHQKVSGESHITVLTVAGKREVNIPTKACFFLGIIAALFAVIILLLLLL